MVSHLASAQPKAHWYNRTQYAGDGQWTEDELHPVFPGQRWIVTRPFDDQYLTVYPEVQHMGQLNDVTAFSGNDLGRDPRVVAHYLITDEARVH